MQAAAKAENKTRDEWAGEAFAPHLESQKCQKLVAFGHENARAHGLKESDVNRLIAESREERRGRWSLLKATADSNISLSGLQFGYAFRAIQEIEPRLSVFTRRVTLSERLTP